MSQRVIIGLTVVLAILLLGAGLIWIKQFKQPRITSPSSNSNSNVNTSTGGTCGSIAGILCPAGYTCVYSDDAIYPDAAGQCVLND